MAESPTFQLRTVLAEASSELTCAGVGSPRVDAELLAAHLLGVSRGALPGVDGLTAEQVAAYRGLVRRRATRIPLQHLTGVAGFRRLDLAVGPGVFVPRPETELLVEWGLGQLRGTGQQGADPRAGTPRGAGRSVLVVDLCSGSGAVALAVADECPTATVLAVEADPAALHWLRRNVGDHPRVRVVAGDATDPAVLADLDGTVDLVLCNPPYVPLGTPVEPEVAEHDPPGAVFGGTDGLDVVRGVVTRAARLLRPAGAAGIEHDDSHGLAVPELLRADGRFGAVTDHRDLAGRQRFATAERLADLPA